MIQKIIIGILILAYISLFVKTEKLIHSIEVLYYNEIQLKNAVEKQNDFNFKIRVVPQDSAQVN